MSAGEWDAEREEMVRSQIADRGVRDRRVLEAIASVPRHVFVPRSLEEEAYADRALPIGRRQTISQPYIVACMSELLALGQEHRVLEVGTGSAYQTAVLSKLAAKVYTVEIVPELARQAEERIRQLGLRNVQVRVGDGTEGWPDEAPFDRIIVTAAPRSTPKALLAQLEDGGRMVIPLGGEEQYLFVLEKRGHEVRSDRGIPVRFVPMTGAATEEGDV